MRTSFIIPAIVLSLGCSQHEGSSRPSLPAPGLSIPDGTPISLGVLPTGGASSQTIRVSNSGSQSVTIKEFSTSCECVTIECKRRVIAPFQETYLTVRYKGELESTFQGPVVVRVTSTDEKGDTILTFGVKVFIVPATEFQATTVTLDAESR